MIPSHTHIPGQTPRHPEGLFDAVKSTVYRGMSVRELAASEAWRTGLDYYRAGYFWEAHEVLGAVLLASEQDGAEQRIVQAVMQLASAALKVRTWRGSSARHLCDVAAAHLSGIPCGRLQVLNLSPAWVLAEIERVRGKGRCVRYNANLDVGGV